MTTDSSFSNPQPSETPRGKPSRYAVVTPDPDSFDKLVIHRTENELPALVRSMRDLPHGTYDIIMFTKVGVPVRPPARVSTAVVGITEASTYGKARKPRDPNAPKAVRKPRKNGK